MQFNITNLQVLRYIIEEPGYVIVPSTNEGADLLEILPGQTYKVSIKIDTTLPFDSIGFNLTWDSGPANFDLVFEDNHSIPKKEDGNLFGELPNDLIINTFLSESPKRLYIMKSLESKPAVPMVPGEYSIVSIFFRTETIEDRVHVFISITSTPSP